METIWIVLILLVATRVCGAIAARLQQPVLVGEILAGVAIGVTSSWVGRDWLPTGSSEEHHLMALADLGIFFLMLLGGYEMRPRDLVDSSKGGLIIAVSAMGLPLISGYLVAWVMLPQTELRIAQSLFVGTALSITAVPVIIKLFIDLDLLKGKSGKLVVSAAVFDDFLSLILLSVLVAILNTGNGINATALTIIIAEVLVFLTATTVAGNLLLPPLARIAASVPLEEMPFSFLLLAGSIFALFAELLGLHFILGAFAAGLFFGKHTINRKTYKDIERKLRAITSGFLAPIFFASIGASLDPTAFHKIPLFLLILFLVAFLGKFLGAAVPALFMGYTRNEAGIIGMAMNARGAVGLVIAGIALDAGLFTAGSSVSPVVENLFSAIVIIVITTTILTPVGIKFLLSRKNGKSMQPEILEVPVD